MLWFMGSQIVGHDWATELNWTEAIYSWTPHFSCCVFCSASQILTLMCTPLPWSDMCVLSETPGFPQNYHGIILPTMSCWWQWNHVVPEMPPWVNATKLWLLVLFRTRGITKFQVGQMAFLSSANSDQLLLRILRLYVEGLLEMPWPMLWVQEGEMMVCQGFTNQSKSPLLMICLFCFTDKNTGGQRKICPNFYKCGRDSNSSRQNSGWRQLTSV